ncbi:hypothetical protein DL93DRAFT_1732574 [Clavulina sp. PMI_390]|nr:hypothetical protein DL93DRAFT_1732574 [Clavulina sp. PMI_390]
MDVRTLRSVEALTFTQVEGDDVRLVLNHWRLPSANTVELNDVFDEDITMGCINTFKSLSRATPSLENLKITDAAHRIKASITALASTEDSDYPLQGLKRLSLRDLDYEWGTQAPPDGHEMDTELLALVRSRRLELLRLFFPPSEETARELRNHVRSLEVIKFVRAGGPKVDSGAYLLEGDIA